MCEPDDRPLPWRWFLRATHFNPYKPKELQRLTGNITVTNGTFDDNCSGEVTAAARSNNQWKENAFVARFRNKGCQAVKENIPGFYNLFKDKEVKGTGMCKFPTGLYEVNNAPVNWSFPNFPILPYGQYRFRLKALKAETLMACLLVDAKVVPRLG
ncbi:uncharacterized protein LOC113205816 [Frankliniella occidentalis]|uniref:Uncharacterized protein LOC113205816 n=1 Tax=Frankliniella occidentalis TaxID=133901 RepID=A0A6J1S9Q9_FRAOC|nr:uncharacterized protein LOC113205816 [Frankliniella occidentalis]